VDEIMMILGCSGWSYDDWLGRFHPLAIAMKGQWLDHYARSFPSVDINRSQFTAGGFSCA
jgi:uncharacterized protein YecE (DUF72 family)